MNAVRLLALYEKVAEAPDAIARLRRFVLDLAVWGKLVSQDPADEPAAELLKRIAAEKARLVKAGEIKGRKLNARVSTGAETGPQIGLQKEPPDGLKSLADPAELVGVAEADQAKLGRDGGIRRGS